MLLFFLLLLLLPLLRLPLPPLLLFINVRLHLRRLLLAIQLCILMYVPAIFLQLMDKIIQILLALVTSKVPTRMPCLRLPMLMPYRMLPPAVSVPLIHTLSVHLAQSSL